jgi:hypothetical protein
MRLNVVYTFLKLGENIGDDVEGMVGAVKAAIQRCCTQLRVSLFGHLGLLLGMFVSVLGRAAYFVWCRLSGKLLDWLLTLFNGGGVHRG